MSLKKEVGVDFLIDAAEKEGVACSTVSDGHVLVFKKSCLESLLKMMADKGTDSCVVFVKRQEFLN